MLFAGWEVRIVKNCDRGLENTFIFLKLDEILQENQNYLGL